MKILKKLVQLSEYSLSNILLSVSVKLAVVVISIITDRDVSNSTALEVSLVRLHQFIFPHCFKSKDSPTL